MQDERAAFEAWFAKWGDARDEGDAWVGWKARADSALGGASNGRVERHPFLDVGDGQDACGTCGDEREHDSHDRLRREEAGPGGASNERVPEGWKPVQGGLVGVVCAPDESRPYMHFQRLVDV